MAANPKTTSLAITPEVAEKWTPAQVELIKGISAQNCTDDEFKVLLYVAWKYDLDPLTREIYAQKYKSWGDQPDKPAAIIVTYAGMQRISNRDNQLDGLSCVALRDQEGRLIGARSELWKKGCSHPFVVEVEFDEYIQYGKNKKGESYVMGLWATKPMTMIKKVANAQNMRQAFSLGQMYAEEEMPTVDALPPEYTEGPAPGLIQPKQTVRVLTDAALNQATIDEARTFIPETLEAHELPPEPTPIRKPATPKAVKVTMPEQAKEPMSQKDAERNAIGAAIDLSYGINTVGKTGQFLPITSDGCLKTLGKMIGATSYPDAAKLIGIPTFTNVINEGFPEATNPGQKYAAILHFVYKWASEKAAHEAEKEAAHAGPK